MVSRLDTRSKDFKTAIRAYASLPQSFRDIYTLQIIGDGPDKELVREYIRENNMDEYIVLRGLDTNPYKWMANAALFLFSSKSEGLGLVILEALACGQMVIATDCPIGPREILNSEKECGVLVPVGDEAQMKNAIIRVLSTTFPIDKYKQNASIRLNDFSTEAFSKKIDKLFQEYE